MDSSPLYDDDNDEDIGALGSILSWDDDDDAAVVASVAATSTALTEREGDMSCAVGAPGDGILNTVLQPQQQQPESGSGGGTHETTSAFLARLAAEIAAGKRMASQNNASFNTAGNSQPQASNSLNLNGLFAQQQQQQQNQQLQQQQQQSQKNSSERGSQVQSMMAPAPVPSNVLVYQSMFPQAGQPMSLPPGMPSIASMQGMVQQQQQQPQFAFTIDPSGLLRQIQVAHAQQFSSVQQQQQQQQQQGQPLAPPPGTTNLTPHAQAQAQNFNQFMMNNAMQSQSFLQNVGAATVASARASQGQGQAGQSLAQTDSASRSANLSTPSLSAAMKQQQQEQQTPNTAQATAKSPGYRGGQTMNIVSCSDTDGETSHMATMTSSTAKEKNRMAKGVSGSATSGVTPRASTSSRANPTTESRIKSPNTTTEESTLNDTADMTPEEKAKANRDRNREHARNTRLRKKAYLEKLKMAVDELCRERDTLVSERASAANLLVEMNNTRTEVLMSFFALRSANDSRRELWASILDESCFACVMPVTPYRSFPSSEVQVSKCQRTILGIDGMMSDTASLHVLLNSLVDRSRYPDASVQFRYTLVTEDAVVAGNQMMARWIMTTLNATQCGARMEVSKQGMLCCKFNSAHKIIGLELMFDVMAFMLQLKQATGSDSFSVVPNTVQTCQRPFDVPMVMTLAERPYTVVQVNRLWEEMTGFNAEDVVGRTSCRVLQGQDTDGASVERLMSAVRYKRPAMSSIVNYTRSGKRFKNYLNVFPLSSDSKITHYLGLTVHIEWIDGNNSGNALESAGHVGMMSSVGPLIQQPVTSQQQNLKQGQQEQNDGNSGNGAGKRTAFSLPQSHPTQQVVLSGSGRQDSYKSGGMDTVSSLTSSVSSASSRGSGGSNGGSGNKSSGNSAGEGGPSFSMSAPGPQHHQLGAARLLSSQPSFLRAYSAGGVTPLSVAHRGFAPGRREGTALVPLNVGSTSTSLSGSGALSQATKNQQQSQERESAKRKASGGSSPDSSSPAKRQAGTSGTSI